MHLEFLIEEPSAIDVLDNIIPKILSSEHTYDIRPFMGKQDLLGKLQQRLMGYKKSYREGTIIIILLDNHCSDCIALKQELERNASSIPFYTKTNPDNRGNYQILNRIICEELESWFLGDPAAIKRAYSNVSMGLLKKYKRIDPDTCEKIPSTKLLKIFKKSGYYKKSSHLPKIEVANSISRHMNPEKNFSNSFNVFLSGILDAINQ